MQIYLGSLYVNNVTLFGRTFEVLLEADNGARGNKSDLSQLYVRNSTGNMVPLSALGRLTPTVGPDTVPHYDLYGAAEITGNPAPGYSSGQAIAAMERAARTLPADFGYEWTGITYQELQAGSVAGMVFALALVFVFLFLAAQYESWTMPFTIILAVPLALFGALGLLWLRHMQVDIYVADRLRPADRAVGEERDPDRRIRQAAARGRPRHRRRGDGGGASPPPPDPDDGLRLHPRRRCR